MARRHLLAMKPLSIEETNQKEYNSMNCRMIHRSPVGGLCV